LKCALQRREIGIHNREPHTFSPTLVEVYASPCFRRAIPCFQVRSIRASKRRRCSTSSRRKAWNSTSTGSAGCSVTITGRPSWRVETCGPWLNRVVQDDLMSRYPFARHSRHGRRSRLLREFGLRGSRRGSRNLVAARGRGRRRLQLRTGILRDVGEIWRQSWGVTGAGEGWV
jgi:hypothetical protein